MIVSQLRTILRTCYLREFMLVGWACQLVQSAAVL